MTGRMRTSHLWRWSEREQGALVEGGEIRANVACQEGMGEDVLHRHLITCRNTCHPEYCYRKVGAEHRCKYFF